MSENSYDGDNDAVMRETKQEVKVFDKSTDVRLIPKSMFADVLDSQDLINTKPRQDGSVVYETSSQINDKEGSRLYHLKMPSSLRMSTQQFDEKNWNIEGPVSFTTEVSNDFFLFFICWVLQKL